MNSSNPQPQPQPRFHPDEKLITVGTRYDEQPVQLQWPYSPHALIAGVTGSGKSSWVASWVAATAADRNTAMLGIDPKQVELDFWEPRFTTLATTAEESVELLQFAVDLMAYRKQILKQHGTRFWDIAYGPAVLLIIEELAELKAIAGKPAMNLLNSLARLSRVFGFTLICTTQYPLAEIVSSELRANLEGKLANRTTGSEQFDVALGKGMAETINPNSIPKSEPGTAYVLGFKNYDTTTKCRAFYPTDNYIKQRAAQTAHLRITPQQLFPKPATNNDQTETDRDQTKPDTDRGEPDDRPEAT